jgi:hypothetical protein
MRNIFRKRVLVAGASIAIIGSGAAAAFLSVGGSGGGSANVTAATTPLVLTTSSPNLTDIGNSQVVKIYAANPDASPQKPKGALAVTAEPSAAAAAAGCPAGSFSISGITPAYVELPGGAAATEIGTATVHFDNVSEEQNACIGSGTVKLTATVGS